MGRSFKQMCVSDLIRVDHDGQIVEGQGLLNGAAFTIHGHIHRAREVTAAAHAIRSMATGRPGRLLDPLTQDACALIMPCWMTTPGWSSTWRRGNGSLGVGGPQGHHHAEPRPPDSGELGGRGLLVVCHPGAQLPGTTWQRQGHPSPSPTRWPGIPVSRWAAPGLVRAQPLFDVILAEQPDLLG